MKPDPQPAVAHGLASPLLLDEDATASRIGVSVYELRRWRREGKGPAFVMIGIRPFYKTETLDRYVAGLREYASAAAALAANPDRAAFVAEQGQRAASARGHRRQDQAKTSEAPPEGEASP